MAPGAVVGLFVGLTERACIETRIQDAKPSRWIALGRVVNGFLTGEGLLGVWTAGVLGLLVSPTLWLIILFFNNLTPWDLAASESASGPTPVGSLLGWGAIFAVCVLNAALAIPLARSERRSREEGKVVLPLLSRLYQLFSRGGIGFLRVVVPLYVLFLSPINPPGPPPPVVSGPLYAWLVYGLAIGGAAAAIELFFFPVGPSRRALNKLRKVVFARQERREQAPLVSA